MNSNRTSKPNLFLWSSIPSHPKLKPLPSKHLRPFSLQFTQPSHLKTAPILNILSSYIFSLSPLQAISLHLDLISAVPVQQLLHLFKSFLRHSHQKSLSLQLSYDNLPHKIIFQKLALILVRLKNLQNLTLILPCSDHQSDLLPLFVSFTHLRLKSLHVALETAKQAPGRLPNLPILTKLISKITTLQNMKLDLEDDPSTPLENSVILLTKMAESLQNLKNLSLAFSEDMDLTAFLPSVKQLEKLEIRAIERKISGIGFLTLSEVIERLGKLKSFSLEFDGIDKATEPTAENLALSLTELQNLKELNLKTHKPSISNNMKMQRMFEFLGELSRIERLNIDLTRFFSAKFALKEIGLGVKNQKNLEELTMNLQECCLTDMEIGAIAEALSGKQRLKKININLRDNRNILGAGVIEILRSLKESSGLQSIYFDFSGISLLNDQSLRGFLDIVACNEKLTQIGLVVCGCKNLSDEWVLKLSDSIKAVKQLRSVVLSFSDCITIGDKSITRFLKTLSNFGKLTQICLGLEKCLITNKTVFGLKDLIEALKELKYAQFKLLGFKKTDNDALIELGNSLRKKKNLARISLDQHLFNASKQEAEPFEDCSQTKLWNFL